MTGWTAEEYAAAPEMADRLHRRILDLQDVLEQVLTVTSGLASKGDVVDQFLAAGAISNAQRVLAGDRLPSERS